jgi:hypothetical protein
MHRPRAAVPATALAVVLACGVAAGCASSPEVFEGRFDARLLPAPAAGAAGKARGAVTLRLDDAAAATTVTVLRLRTVGNVPVALAMGTIVEGAARAALAEEFEGADGAAAGDPAFVLRLLAVRFDVDDHVVYILPLGPLTTGRIDLDSRLWVEAQLIAPQGRVQWTRTYDSGREPPASGRRGVVGPWEGRLPPQQVQAMAHEQAFRLMQLAAKDVRRWVESERVRERAL